MSRCERCGGKDHATSQHDAAHAAPANRSPECDHGVTIGTYCQACVVDARPEGAIMLLVSLDSVAGTLERMEETMRRFGVQPDPEVAAGVAELRAVMAEARARAVQVIADELGLAPAQKGSSRS